MQLDSIESGLSRPRRRSTKITHDLLDLRGSHGPMRQRVLLDLGRREGDAVCVSQETQVDPPVGDLHRYLGALFVGGLYETSHSLDVAIMGDAELANGGLPVVRNVGVASDDETHAAASQVLNHVYGRVRHLSVVSRGAIPRSGAHEAITDVDPRNGDRIERCGV